MISFFSFFVCFFLILYVSYIKVFQLWVSIILTLSLFSIFFINDYLFPTVYFIDQYEYLRFLIQIRNFLFDFSSIETIREWYSDRYSVKVSTTYLSILPLPTPGLN